MSVRSSIAVKVRSGHHHRQGSPPLLVLLAACAWGVKRERENWKMWNPRTFR
ncbi:hypothetical protein SESBI_16737 [Sesbania bispinosa]|nr:hypothetical protein SESBI_16737 [Sesbania bispinosa]